VTSSTSSSTVVATHSTSCKSANVTSSTTFSTETIAATSNTSTTARSMNGSFSYSPQSPISVESVQVILNQNQNGDRYATFSVAIRNIGNSPIYIIKGCGSSLDSSVTNSIIIQEVKGMPRCLCAEAPAPLDSGKTQTLSTPGCRSGYAYKVTGSGTVSVNFVLSWASSGQNLSGTYSSVSITGSFSF
jgi:hypothetical protein